MGPRDFVIVDVWRGNFLQEFEEFASALARFPVIAMDTEFPGCLISTPRDASDAERYRDMCFNLKRTKVIQLGMSLCDQHGSIYRKAWQFNFRFDVDREASAPKSIEFLKTTAGFDFEALKNEGIGYVPFSVMFARLLALQRTQHGLTWVTFHGSYDLGYVLQLLTNRFLPDSVSSFTRLMSMICGNVLDLKYMAKFCQGLRGGEIGLDKLATILGVGRVGNAHQAGSDSLLTAMVYVKMTQIYSVQVPRFYGVLFGITPAIDTLSPRYCLSHSRGGVSRTVYTISY